jgi:hypothetical protein
MTVLRGFHFGFLTQQAERIAYIAELGIGSSVRKVTPYDRLSGY